MPTRYENGEARTYFTARIYSPCEDGADGDGYVEVTKTGPISGWLAKRLINNNNESEREWRDREIAKRLKEIEDGTYE